MARTRRRRRLRRFLLLGTLLLAAAAGALAVAVSRVPRPAVVQQEQSTLLFAAAGERLAALTGNENRVSIPIRTVPRVVVQAVVATEDRHFYDHSGIDPLGIARAALNNLRGGSLQGGSTITQQYVKNAYVGGERSFGRKLREAALAVKIESRLSKDELLERYLNTVYFGRGAYGIEAAAHAWFGTGAASLGLREAAYLAGLIRAPSRADVAKDAQEAARRRTLSLRAMVQTGSITRQDAAEVEAQPLAGYVVPRGRGVPDVVGAPKGAEFVVDHIRRQLLRDYGAARTNGGGLRVKTTIDLDAQRAAYDAVYGTLDKPGDPAGALVAVDERGAVRAVGGGRDFATSKVDLALGTAGGGRGRQPGSTFKPFLLAEIVAQGYTPASTFPAPGEIVLPGADAGRDWRVRNYDMKFYGNALSLVDATRHSVNTAYAQAELVVGPARLASMAKDLGVTAPLRPVASLVLGSVEVSVLDIVSTYSTLARRGDRVTPWFVESVETIDGEVLYTATPSRTRVLTETQADTVNTVLTDVVERGTGTRARLPGAAANTLTGKTGTTNDYTDAWFAGSTTRLSTAVWVGYPEGKATMARFRGGGPVTGGTVPADIWRRFMAAATKGQKLERFVTVDHYPGKRLR